MLKKIANKTYVDMLCNFVVVGRKLDQVNTLGSQK